MPATHIRPSPRADRTRRAGWALAASAEPLALVGVGWITLAQLSQRQLIVGGQTGPKDLLDPFEIRVEADERQFLEAVTVVPSRQRVSLSQRGALEKRSRFWR
ncbi:putative membrane protein [Candidatus Protofrankia californiensis]|uniref:Putative membrane protein n=1 Tax=Candidatus Protofrankia californiensis TaxID=1839754 RepID=A0A1C3PGB6_9ACTN|nr:putative membrane protein [Candidatus Protofrankia californiensis]